MFRKIGFIALVALAAFAVSAQTNTIITGTDVNTVTGASTNANWTDMSVKAWSGYQYQGNSGDSTALLGASIELGTFNAGSKLGTLNYGLGTELTIGATGTAVSSAAARIELSKDMGSTQVSAFAGFGRDFANKEWFGEFGVAVNYNLYKSQNWFAYAGTGIDFRVRPDGNIDYLPCIRTGIAF